MRRVRSLTALVSALLLLAGCQQPVTDIATGTSSAQSAVDRGEYLVAVGGCHDCHTPKIFGPDGAEPDLSRRLSGHPADDALPPLPAGQIAPDGWGVIVNNHLTAWAGAWGVSFAANLTPDQATGMGSWTEDMFVKALRTGKHQGAGRPILPPMPWFWYQNMTDDDLKAVFAYLQSLPPIANPIPEPMPPDAIP